MKFGSSQIVFDKIPVRKISHKVITRRSGKQSSHLSKSSSNDEEFTYIKLAQL